MHSYYFVFSKVIIVVLILSLFSCGKKEGSSSSAATSSSQASCTPKRMAEFKSNDNQEEISKKIKFGLTDLLGTNTTLTASSFVSGVTPTRVPLLVVRVQYSNVTFQSNEATWANKIFGTGNGQLNEFLDETTYGKYQFNPVNESSGTSNNGVVTVTISENHPDTQGNSWTSHAYKAIKEADSSVNFAAYDNNSNGKLSVSELQVIFLVAGGESATGNNNPGGVWAMASSLYFDGNGDGLVDASTACTSSSSSQECNGVTLDSVSLLGLTSTGQNGFSQFGERQGSSSNSHDATIGVIAHELGHAYFDLPDLYCTSGVCEGIGNFGLMGAGSWGLKSSSEKAGETPVHFSAWSKENLSVCVPQTVGSGTNNLTLPAAYQSSTHASSCGIYKATTSTSGEYFLFENRSSGGYDQGLKYLILDGSGSSSIGSSYTGGLAVWHIKDILSSCNSQNNCQNQSPSMVDLEEANHGDLDEGSSRGRTTHLFYSGNNEIFNDTSDPSSKLYDCSSSGISVTNISSAGNSMTLTISK